MAENKRKTLVVAPDLHEQPEIARWLWAFQDSRKRTMEVLEGLTQEVIDWEPDGAGSRISSLLYHIAAIEMDWFFEEVLVEPFTPEIVEMFPIDIREENGRLSQVTGMTVQEHLDRLAYVRKLVMDAYSKMDLADFRRARELELYDVTPEYVLHHLMQHEAEHRSQIGALRIHYREANS